MATAPPPGEDPRNLDLKNLMPPPPIRSNGGSVSWPQVALASVSAALTLGTAWLAGSTSRSASTAERAVVITQKQVDEAFRRRDEIDARSKHNEDRIEALEKWQARMEAMMEGKAAPASK